MRHGEAHHGAKVHEADVLAIREAVRLRKTLTNKALAARLGISIGQVYRIACGKAWEHSFTRTGSTTLGQ